MMHHANGTILTLPIHRSSANMMCECKHEIINHFISYNLDEYNESILNKSRDYFLHEAMGKSLRTIDNWAERLGYKESE